MKNNTLLVIFGSVTVFLMVVVLVLTFNELVNQSAMDNARRATYQQKMMQAQHISLEREKLQTAQTTETPEQIINSIISSADEQLVVDEDAAEITAFTSDEQNLDGLNQLIYE